MTVQIIGVRHVPRLADGLENVLASREIKVLPAEPPLELDLEFAAYAAPTLRVVDLDHIRIARELLADAKQARVAFLAERLVELPRRLRRPSTEVIGVDLEDSQRSNYGRSEAGCPSLIRQRV